MAERDFYDKYDIMNKLEICESRAMAIIRAVKHYTGDMLKIKGKVLVTEYEAWKNAILQPKQKNSPEAGTSREL